MSASHHHHHHDESIHSHSHAVADYGRAFLIGIILNVAFIALEIIYGLHAESLALLADAGHNAGDVLGLCMSWTAVMLAKRTPNARYTYGLQSSSILAALANAVLLLVACGSIGLEAVQRFSSPHPIDSGTVMGVAAAGIAVNGITAWLFMSGKNADLNIRGAFLHMAADALVSLGVVISAVVMIYTGWMWLDPLISLVIAGVIIAGTWSLLKDSFGLALHATPKHIDTEQVRDYLAALPEVKEVHDLHIWAMSTNETALSTHLLVAGAVHPGDAFLKETARALEEHFRIGHSTIQIEIGDDGAPCTLAALH
jgi:cobalt-zinc-cadmium efflux system protein